MMIEHEDHDRTPDRIRTIVATLIFVGLGAYGLIASLLDLALKLLRLVPFT
jgi:hypothetical protein